MRYLPPLNALKAFFAASRHKNFSEAAADLHVTHGAVSRHVRQLEDILGVQLFRRLPRGVELTDEGRALAFASHEAFDIISDATERFRDRSSRNEVSISTVPSIAARWLVPRLEKFQRDNPDIEIKITTTMRLVNPRTDNIDFVIRYGRGNWLDMTTEPLFSKNLTAVCSPELSQLFEPEPCYECLRDTRLLISDGYRYWETFLKAAGFEEFKSLAVMELDDSNVAIQAAIAGQGVALLPEVLVEEEISAGRLVRPFPETVPTEFGYFLGISKDYVPRDHVQKVIDWVITEAKGDEMNEAMLP